MSEIDLLILHGAVGSSKQFGSLADKLASNFRVHTMDFAGHGGIPLPEEKFSIEMFANNVLQWMKSKSISKVNIFGYSMGGYVALYLAAHHPEKTSKIFTLATKQSWNPEISAREVKMLDPQKIEEKIPAFAKTLEQRHSPADWKKVLRKTAEMMLAMGEKNVLTDEHFSAIETSVLLSVGDKDKMVSLEETTHVFRKLKSAQLLVLPDTTHPIEAVDEEVLIFHLNKFFSI